MVEEEEDKETNKEWVSTLSLFATSDVVFLFITIKATLASYFLPPFKDFLFVALHSNKIKMNL